MADEPAYHLDIAGLGDAEQAAESVNAGRRPWLGVQFECCGAYARIYRNRDGTAYQGRCPHCLRAVTIRIGAGGTSARMFRAL